MVNDDFDSRPCPASASREMRLGGRCLVAAALSVGVLLTACASAEDVLRSDSQAGGGGTTTYRPPVDASERGLGDGPPGHGLDRFYDQEVDWADCDGGDQCASIWVPLDYADPDGLGASPSRPSAAGRRPRQAEGHAVHQPGWAGWVRHRLPGLRDLRRRVHQLPSTSSASTRAASRRSTPIDCLDDADLDAYVAADPSPDTSRGGAGARADVEPLTCRAARRTRRPLLAHVSTVEVARDMDIMRAVVGDDQLHYYGASYGTYIGATYAGAVPRQGRPDGA